MDRINPDNIVWADFFNPGPSVYELADSPGTQPGGTYTWRIVEVEASGRENVYGPYTVTVDGAAAGQNGYSGDRF